MSIDWEILTPVALTTIAGLAVLAPQTSHVSLRDAIVHTLERLGLATLFFLLNLMTGALVILVARAFGTDISMYVISDGSLLALSLVQGLVFGAWRRPTW